MIKTITISLELYKELKSQKRVNDKIASLDTTILTMKSELEKLIRRNPEMSPDEFVTTKVACRIGKSPDEKSYSRQTIITYCKDYNVTKKKRGSETLIHLQELKKALETGPKRRMSQEVINRFGQLKNEKKAAKSRGSKEVSKKSQPISQPDLKIINL